MDASTASWILVALGVLTMLGSIATQMHYSGRLVERVNQNTLDIVTLQKDVKGHETRISRIEGKKPYAANV